MCTNVFNTRRKNSMENSIASVWMIIHTFNFCRFSVLSTVVCNIFIYFCKAFVKVKLNFKRETQNVEMQKEIRIVV